MKTNYNQLTFAREFRGISQSELAGKINGLSQSNLSKYEKGLQTLSSDLLVRIMDYLDFPVSFLEVSISNNIESAHYRKKASLKKGIRNEIERQIKLIGYMVDCMSSELEFPPLLIKQFDQESALTPEEIADYARRFFNLGGNPVKDIYTMMETAGIIVVEKSFMCDDFDAVSFLTDGGSYVIVINKNYSNDRKRFTLAHELGHIVMHLGALDCRRGDKEKEDEANRFAQEFLLPKKYIMKSLVDLKLSHLSSMKGYWLTSMASIVRRAKSLGVIDDSRYKYFNIELSRNGFRKHEPVEVPIDAPTLFKEAYRLFTSELGYTDGDISKAFYLPLDVVENIFNDSYESRLRYKFAKAFCENKAI